MSTDKKNQKKRDIKKDTKRGAHHRKSVGGGMIEVPDPVYRIWLEFSGSQDPELFKKNVERFRELWRVFTSRRERVAADLLHDPGAAAAYLTGFHLPNAARAQLLYRRLAQRLGILPGSHGPDGGGRSSGAPSNGVRLDALLKKHFTRQRIFDLGCGSAAWTQVWLTNFRLAVNSIHLFDSSQALLNLSEAMIRSLMQGFSLRNQFFIESTAGDIASVDFSRYQKSKTSESSRDPDIDKKTLDIFLLGYIWNELSQDHVARARIMATLDQHVERELPGLLILAEPATDMFAWGAMALRDELSSRGWGVVYPCPSGIVACPMINGKNGLVDWCFSEGAWRKPETYTPVEHESGVGRNKLNSAMFVLASPTLYAQLEKVAPALTAINQVVVGKPAVGSQFSYLLCTNHGLMKTTPKKVNRAYAKPRGSVLAMAARPDRRPQPKSKDNGDGNGK